MKYLAFLAPVLLAHPGPVAAEQALPVVVSLPPHAWLVESVGGERVSVTTLVSPGDSPATYQPSDSQVSHALRARLVFLSGAPFERGAWYSALHEAPGLDRVDLARGLAIAPGAAHPTASLGTDPHLWLSPRRLALQARRVAEALSRHDPPGRDQYARSLAAVVDQLTWLEGEIAKILRPFSGRAFMVFHPSWGYFAEDFGLRQIAIERDGKEPSDHQLTQLRAVARSERITTVFVQPQFRGRAARAAAGGIGARLATLDPLARDVPANLLSVARSLAESFDE